MNSKELMQHPKEGCATYKGNRKLFVHKDLLSKKHFGGTLQQQQRQPPPQLKLQQQGIFILAAHSSEGEFHISILLLVKSENFMYDSSRTGQIKLIYFYLSAFFDGQAPCMATAGPGSPHQRSHSCAP